MKQRIFTIVVGAWLICPAALRAQQAEQTPEPAMFEPLPDPTYVPENVEPEEEQKVETTTENEPNFFIWPQPAALEGPIASERPGFSDSAGLVQRGHANLEIGYGYAHDHEDHFRSDSHSVANSSLRVGLLDDLELRVKWGGYSLVDSKFQDVSPGGRTYINHQHDDGATDMSVGFKIPIVKHCDCCCLPNVSIIPALSLPTGGKTKTSDDVDPSLEVAWNYPVTDKLTIYGVGGIAGVTDSNGRYPQAVGSLAASYALTDRLGVFVEYFGIYPSTRSTDCQHNIDGGAAYILTDNIQLDISVGMGLNEEAPDFFTGAGFSIRF